MKNILFITLLLFILSDCAFSQVNKVNLALDEMNKINPSYIDSVLINAYEDAMITEKIGVIEIIAAIKAAYEIYSDLKERSDEDEYREEVLNQLQRNQELILGLYGRLDDVEALINNSVVLITAHIDFAFLRIQKNIIDTRMRDYRYGTSIEIGSTAWLSYSDAINYVVTNDSLTNIDEHLNIIEDMIVITGQNEQSFKRAIDFLTITEKRLNELLKIEINSLKSYYKGSVLPVNRKSQNYFGKFRFIETVRTVSTRPPSLTFWGERQYSTNSRVIMQGRDDWNRLGFYNSIEEGIIQRLDLDFNFSELNFITISTSYGDYILGGECVVQDTRPLQPGRNMLYFEREFNYTCKGYIDNQIGKSQNAQENAIVNELRLTNARFQDKWLRFKAALKPLVLIEEQINFYKEKVDGL